MYKNIIIILLVIGILALVADQLVPKTFQKRKQAQIKSLIRVYNKSSNPIDQKAILIALMNSSSPKSPFLSSSAYTSIYFSPQTICAILADNIVESTTVYDGVIYGDDDETSQAVLAWVKAGCLRYL